VSHSHLQSTPVEKLLNGLRPVHVLGEVARTLTPRGGRQRSDLPVSLTFFAHHTTSVRHRGVL
jgi:hypothetical protein